MSRCINTILQHYLIAAIFTAGDGEFDHYGADEFTEEARAKSREDIESFLQQAKAQNIDTSLWSDEMLGHDFSLTRVTATAQASGIASRRHQSRERPFLS